MVLSIIFTTYTRNGLKNCNLNKTLYYSKLVLKKDKCSSVENTLVLKFDKAILKKKNRIDNIDYYYQCCQFYYFFKMAFIKGL